MGSVTPYVISGEGYVRVEVNWQDFPHARKCWIYRRVAPSDPLVMLRGGNATRMSNGIAVAFDHEAPLDVPLIYRSVIALNWNGDFTEGVSEWLDTTNTGTVGTVTQSFDYYVAGESNASLKLVPSGAATSRAVSEYIPATAGQVYTISGRLMVPDFWTGGIGVQIHWYNGTTFLSAAGATNDFAPYPGNWDTYGFSATAPATTTNARIVAAIGGTPTSAAVMYAGEMYLTTTGTGINAASSVVVQSAGGGWWTDPLHPWTKVRLQVELENASDLCGGPSGVVYLGLTEKSLPADSTTLEVNDATYGVGTWNKRKAARSSIRIGTRTAADEAKVELLHAAGAPLFFHMNADYGETDFYGLYGDFAVVRVHGDQRVPWRMHGVAYAEQAAPVGPAEGTLKARYMDFTRLTSFAAAEALNGGAYDTYTRTTANGWGTSTSGLATTTSGGAASVYSTNGSQGVIAVEALNALRLVLYPVSLVNFRIRGRSIGFTPTGGNPEIHYFARYVDSVNFVRVVLYRQAAGGMTVRVSQVVAGVETASGFVTVAGAANNSTVRVELVGTGTTLDATAWVDGTVKPLVATVSLAGVTMVTAGQVGSAVNLPGTVTNALPLSTIYDDLDISALDTGPTWLDGLQGELVA